MHCYNHADRDAVGICKACSKGLCSKCAVDLGYGISCRGAQEHRVAEIEQLISRNAQVQRTAGGAKYVAPLFLLFMGAVFTGYGILYAGTWDFIVILGIGFVVYGAYCLVVNRRAYGKTDPTPDTSRDRTERRA